MSNERRERGLKLYYEWKDSGLTQKEFLSKLPKYDDDGLSMSGTFQIGVNEIARNKKVQLMKERMDRIEKQNKFNNEHYAYNPYFEKIANIERELSVMNSYFERLLRILEKECDDETTLC